MLGFRGDLRLQGIGLIHSLLSHQRTDLLRQPISLRTQAVSFHFGAAAFRIKSDDFIDQRKLLILKLIVNILLDDFGVLPKKL